MDRSVTMEAPAYPMLTGVTLANANILGLDRLVTNVSPTDHRCFV